MNKAMLIGNLTRDPELTETPSGVAVCKFGLAVSRPYTQGDGEKMTDFFNIVVWRGLGESCARFLKKGKKAAITGSIQTRSYEGDDGVKRNVVEIVAQEVEFLSPRDSEDEEPQQTRKGTGTRKATLTPMDDDSDIPF